MFKHIYVYDKCLYSQIRSYDEEDVQKNRARLTNWILCKYRVNI